MGSDDDKSSKTEEATPKKRDEAFQEGTFARTGDIGVVFVLIASFIILTFYGKKAPMSVCFLAKDIFTNLKKVNLTEAGVAYLFKQNLLQVFWLLFPLLMACFLGAFIAGALQTGLKLTPKVLHPKWEKVNPVSGFKRLFSVKNYVKGIVDFIKLIIVGVVIYLTLLKIVRHEIFTSPIPINYIALFIYETFIHMLLWLIFTLGIIAVINYFYERSKVNKELMMTKQEVKDERKDQERSPLVRGFQRALARRLLRKQILQQVPLSDVVVTNPTHYAVALKYETGKDLAPIVLAKGENMFAKRIKKIAHLYDVPIVENKPVAKVLFKVGQVGQPIPVSLYQVIADILSHVYKTNKYYFYKLKERRNKT